MTMEPDEAAGLALEDLFAKLGHYPGCRAHRRKKARPHMPAKGRRRRKHAAVEKCGCGCGCALGDCPRKKVKVVGPERREAGGRYSWRGRAAKSITDDPGYEKYTRKQAAMLALDGLLRRR
jgi:hypothetical protein